MGGWRDFAADVLLVAASAAALYLWWHFLVG